METQYDEEALGCGAIVLAYALGSYLFALILVVSGLWHWTMAFAPAVFPLYAAIAVLLTFGGNSEIGMNPIFFFLGLVDWIASIVAARGILCCWNQRRFRYWPVLLPVAIAVATILVLRRY